MLERTITFNSQTNPMSLGCFLSTLALALILVVPRHWPELAILSTAPLDGVTLWDIWIWQRMAHSWLMVRRALV